MKIHFLGAADGVTGSRHLVESAGSRILLDCGLFQGWKLHRERNWVFPPELRELDAVVISHAHLDHSGWLPALVKHGYRGAIHASPATCELARVLLLDSAHLQEEDARRANRGGWSRHTPAKPLYTVADAKRALLQLKPLAPGRSARVGAVQVTLSAVGHLLGACSVRLAAGHETLVFSGDLGRSDDLLMAAPLRQPKADVLLVESTYGNRCHPKEDVQARLGEIIRATTRRGGSVLDSVGQVGAEPPQQMAQQNLQRDADKSDGCAPDLKVEDNFDPEQRFAEKPAASEVVMAREERCENATDLLIDGVASAIADNTAVVMRNDSNDPIDLTGGGYALEVYFAGNQVPGRKIALEGMVNPGESFVVASPDADPTVRQMANLVSPSARVSPGDSVVLKRGSAISDCRGVPTAMAVIANALGSEAGTRWVNETAKEYDTGRALRTVDAVGQAGMGREDWQGTMAGEPMTLKRQNDMCQSDTEPSDSFAVAGGWVGTPGVVPAELGQTADRCSARSADLVISQYANDGERYRAVEILNNTSGDVDLAGGGYVLEIYADGATEPTRTVALDGQVKSGQAFVLADSDSPSDVRERSQMVTSDLTLERINALVLRRINVVGGRACAAEVIAATRDIGPSPIPLALVNPLVPSRGPSNDDPLVGSGGGGELASPN